MTTKKQSRENAEAKRARFDAETKRLGLEAQQHDWAKRQKTMAAAEAAVRSRVAKAATKHIKDAPVPDNVAVSYANSQGIDLPKLETVDV